MKILVISNFYPPQYIGGYEIGCMEAVEGLKSRGHQVKVLTSNYQVNAQELEKDVYRWLKLQFTDKTDRLGLFKDLFLIEIHNHIALQRLLFTFQPDLVYVWNIAQISVSLLFNVQKQKIPLAYFIFDHWLSKWQQDPWYVILGSLTVGLKAKLCNMIAHPFLKYTGFFIDSSPLTLSKNIQFASQYLKDSSLKANQSVQDAIIIPWGLKLNKYPFKEEINNPCKLLYVGQLVEHKGVHTIIKALKLLIRENLQITLTIVGGTTVPSYENSLKELASSLGLENKIDFRGFVKRENLIPIYQEHSILLFPSIWEEPFGITLLEGMALGLAVVSTNNGGSKEIVQDGFNALIFPGDDSQRCAEQIQRLINDPILFKTLRLNARLCIEQKYDLNRTLDQIENSLYQTMSVF